MLDEERRKLVEDNIGFMYSTARSFWNLPLDYSEILSACGYGMVKAAETFENGKGACFITYSSMIMRNEVLMAMRKQKHLFDRIGAYLDDQENSPINSEKIPDSSQRVEDMMCDNVVLQDAINTLSEFEKNVIYLTYFTDKKQGEISSMVGFSQSYVSRVIKKSIHKMHTWCNEMGCLN